MKYVAYYMLFSMSSLLVMAFFNLPDRFFGWSFILFLIGAVVVGIRLYKKKVFK